MAGGTLSEADKGALTLVETLTSGDDEAFYRLLMGLSLPLYHGTHEEPYRAVLIALQRVEMLGKTIQSVKSRLARRLADFMAGIPAEGAFSYGGAGLLFNMYQLAMELACPRELANALEQEVKREEAYRNGVKPSPVTADDQVYFGGPVRRYLFHACIENQIDDRFAWLWQQAMADVADQRDGVRHYWGVHWFEAFQGICLTPNRRNRARIARPSFANLYRALPFLMASTEAEYPEADQASSRAKRLRSCLERFCAYWRLPLKVVVPFVVMVGQWDWRFSFSVDQLPNPDRLRDIASYRNIDRLIDSEFDPSQLDEADVGEWIAQESFYENHYRPYPVVQPRWARCYQSLRLYLEADRAPSENQAVHHKMLNGFMGALVEEMPQRAA